MKLENNYSWLIAPVQSMKPNKIVLYNDVSLWDKENNCIVKRNSNRNKVEKSFHNFQLSSAAKNRLKEKISWLYALSKSRYKKSLSGREVFNFKMAFITLTLPSSQIHSTSEITSSCFNQWLTEIRAKYNMQNFVWRLEFQKNGNVHYHIATDCYIEYHIAQKIWNRIVNKLGYVERFTEKFMQMSFSEYCNLDHNNNIDKNELSRRFAKGRANGWKIPKSVDIKSCTSGKAIAYYISKYFSKKENEFNKCNSLDNEDNSFGLRLWFCSRSLSKLDAVKQYCECADINFENELFGAKGIFKIVREYCTIIYYNISTLLNDSKRIFYQLLRNYAFNLNYSPAT
jgi:hypothetical protein